MKHFTRLMLIVLTGQVIAVPLTIVVLIAILPLLRSLEASTGLEMIGHSGPAEWVIVGVWAVISLCITATLVATRQRKKGSAHED